MKLHVLGVSGPFPESNGATSGYLLEAGNTLLQLDLGSGILARLTALVPPESLSALLLSHWHFDHTAALTVLLYRLEAMGQAVRIYAPADGSSALRKIVSAAGKHVIPSRRSDTGSNRKAGSSGIPATLIHCRPWPVFTGMFPCCSRMGSFLPKTGQKENRTFPQPWPPRWPVMPAPDAWS